MQLVTYCQKNIHYDWSGSDYMFLPHFDLNYVKNYVIFDQQEAYCHHLFF
jgi:hypothetical protein